MLLAMAKDPPGRGPGRPRLRGALDQLARVPGRRATRDEEPTFAAVRGVLEGALPGVHPGVRRGGERRARGISIVAVARLIGAARGAFASHVWRGAASGNLGGWQVARALQLLTVLTASVGTRGGTSPHAWNKYKPIFWEEPPAQKRLERAALPQGVAAQPLRDVVPAAALPEGGPRQARRLLHPRLQPGLDQPGRDDVDGGARGTSRLVGLHAALTPTWSETAIFADYVLPMGHAGERHDIQSQETQSGRWVSFRQPVLRAARERMGETFRCDLGGEPGRGVGGGRVLDRPLLAHRPRRRARDPPAGSSRPTRAGRKLTVHEYYRWIFENAVPGLPEAAAKEGLAPLDYMRTLRRLPDRERRPRPPREGGRDVPASAVIDPATGVVSVAGKAVGVRVGDEALAGFPTPSRKLEIFSRTMKDWGWGDEALPGYIQQPRPPPGLDPATGRDGALADVPACPP